MKSAAILLVTILTLCSMSSVPAQEPSLSPENSEHPIDISAKKAIFRVIPGGREVVFENNVKVKQNDLTLTCDKLVVTSEEKKKRNDGDKGKKIPRDISDVGEFKFAVATGNIQVVQNELKASAGKAVLDNVKRTITLTEGPPRIRQGPNVVEVQTIVFYLDENRAEMLGDIKAVFNPAKTPKEKEKQ